MIHRYRVFALLALGSSSTMLAWSQVQPPDAGRILQDQRPPLLTPEPSPSLLKIIPLEVEEVRPGGGRVTLSGVRIRGNTRISEATLLDVLGEVQGKSFDLAGLRGLADKLSVFYRSSGYPFARAFVPPQPLTDATLRIEVVEGRYGAVNAIGKDAGLREGAQSALMPLRPGEVIDGELLERTTLLLGDRPGIKVSPVIRPGREVGSGDLEVIVERESGFVGDLRLDNQGNRYTGEYRLTADLKWDSPFLFGDQLSATVLVSDESMWMGGLTYSLPLNAHGLRGQMGYSQTYYELGQEFARLKATGTAKVTTLGLTYPWFRSQRLNVNLSANLQHKVLNDKQAVARVDDDKSSISLPVQWRFDRRDELWGGGLSYGGISYTAGYLTLGQNLKQTDITSRQDTRGFFDKLNIDLARIQATPHSALTLYARASAQWAGKNLDSSESFSLGGPNGVRAYPSGEGSGDAGWLTQLEARYNFGHATGYLFHDAGHAKVNARPSKPSDDLNRSISGIGLGLRYQRLQWSMDASLAWRGRGGPAQADTKWRDPRLWVALSYRF